MTVSLDQHIPELDWIQIEITTNCNADCIYCPNSLIKTKKDLPFNSFQKLLPILTQANLVYLQGWGEPLLNTGIFEMIRICKEQKIPVGFTTNGMLLDEDAAEKLVDLQLDILAVSFAGSTDVTHNKIRKGTDFKKIISNLNTLNQIKSRKKSSLPKLHLAYIMLRSNFEEIDNIAALAVELNASQIVLSNLTLLLNLELGKEALFNDEKNYEYYISTLEKLKKIFAQNNIILDYSRPSLGHFPQICSENVSNSLVIDVNGNVSPCVFTMPSLSERSERDFSKIFFRYFKEKKVPVSNISFGNVNSEKINDIWNKKEYINFRKYFSHGNLIIGNLDTQLPETCKTCYKSFV